MRTSGGIFGSGVLPCLGFVLALGATGAHAETMLALDDPDIAFESPRVATDGLSAVAQRSYYVNETFPQTGVELLWSDIVALDLRADCSEDLVREVTRDGASFGASITEFGGGVRYWRADGSGGFELVGHALSTGAETVHLNEATRPAAANSSPDGSMATWIRPGSPAQLMLADISVVPPTLNTVASGTLDLAHEHPLPSDGLVRFRMQVSGVYQLFVGDGSAAATQLTFGTENHGPPSLSTDGSLMSFHRTTSGGVRNVFSWNGTGTPLQLTANGSTETTFSDVSLASDGEWVVFASNGDWDPTVGNADGSNELFRVRADGSGSIEQLSDITALTDRDVLVAGTSAAGLRSLVLYGASTSGTIGQAAGARHGVAVHLELLDASTPSPISTWDETLTVAAPPFDVRSQPPGGGSLVCSTVSATVTCGGWLRNASDQARTVLLVPEWRVEPPAACGPVLVREVRQVSLQEQEGVVVTSTLPLNCAGTGSYRLRVIDFEQPQADMFVQVEDLF